MSKLYFDTQTKHEFIHNITHLANIKSQLVCIKKYHKYEPFLNFLPLVLSDIVMSYINDVFVIDYIMSMNIVSRIITISFNSKMYINYRVCFMHCGLRFAIINNKLVCISSSSISGYNMYMKQYYNENCYIHTTCRILPVRLNIKNHKVFKHKIIITKKVINIIQKIDNIIS